MSRYVSDPIAVDRASIKAEMQDALEALQPGTDFSAGTSLDFVLDVFSQFHAENLQTFTQQLAISFRYGLEKIDRIIQRTATQATASATLVRTAADAAVGARTVTAGTQFNLLGTTGEPVPFELVTDVTFAAADASEACELIAVQGGTGGNGLSTVIGPATTVTWFQSLTATGSTSGGEDAETDEAFLDRGADTRPGRAFTIVLPDDLARFLRNQSGVDRVQVINNYDADTSTAGVGGHMTAIPIDADGAALSGGTMTALEAAAQEITNLNGTIHVIAPTDTMIAVVFAGVAETGFDASDVETRAEAAVLDFLDRSAWGLPKSGDVRDWLDVRTVRYQDVITVLNNVQGFDYYTSLTINAGTADVAMTGPGALPSASSTASGTVTAP